MNKKVNKKKKFSGSAEKFRFAIVVSQFNDFVTSKLLNGAKDCLKEHKVLQKNVEVFYCPGAFELPQVANILAPQKKWDAIICLGAVIRGETPHFDYVCSETARGIQDVALKHSIPVVFGVLTTDNEKQAFDRVGGTQGDKGWDAALTAIEMVALNKKIKKK